MREDELVQVIAQQVRARLMAGGQGAGYVRPMPHAAKADVPMTHEGLRVLSCDVVPNDDDCGDCGMCVVRRPEHTRGIQAAGADRIGAGVGTGRVEGGLAGMIDHTLLKPEATKKQLLELAEEARKHNFATVCVNSSNVRLMSQFLQGSGVPVCAVVGFPLGSMTARSKAYETREAIRCGAREIDMVLNIGALKSKEYDLVLADISAVVQAAKPVGVKVILETSKLTVEEKIIGCALSKAAGAAFVKTSTGFGGGGATSEDITLMRRIVGPEMGVKASGGVRSVADAEAMIAAGATRLGASASVAIVTGGTSTKGY
jgi:deoxyribose-phosphate aldolase